MLLSGLCLSEQQWNAFTVKQLLTLASLSASMMPPVCSCSNAYALCRAWYSFVSCRNRSSDSSAARLCRRRKGMPEHQRAEHCQGTKCKWDLLSTIVGLQVLTQIAVLVSCNTSNNVQCLQHLYVFKWTVASFSSWRGRRKIISHCNDVTTVDFMDYVLKELFSIAVYQQPKLRSKFIKTQCTL